MLVPEGTRRGGMTPTSKLPKELGV